MKACLVPKNIMPRFFSPKLDKDQKNISLLDKDEIHHLVDVLRLKVGNEVTIFNGEGLEARTIISSISHKEAIFEVISFYEKARTYPLLVLACAIPKRSKFETIIEKCTELGIDEIIPLKTQRTEIAKTAENLARRHHRYEDVAINACKQSQRFFLPKVHPVTKFDQALAGIFQNDLALIGSLKDPTQRLCDLTQGQLQAKNRILIFIGPEGDFTDEEIHHAIGQGCIPITLGSNVLKVETAAIATVAYLSLQFRS